MRTAEQTLHEAGLAAALTAAQEAARREPAKSEHRVFLFQLLAVLGEWTKALRQLDILSDLDPRTELLAKTWRPLIACEQLRREVFSSRKAPLCLGHPPPWFAHLLEALRLDAEGGHGAAKALREQAFAAAEATAGRLDGVPFAWLADMDERLGPVLEVVVDGRYFWLPVERLTRLESEGPKDLRDLVWLPVRLTFANQGETVGFVPVRYPGSEAEGEDALRLARRTEWRQPGEGSWRGLGQRMLATDAGEHPFLDLRLIELDVEPPPAEAAGA